MTDERKKIVIRPTHVVAGICLAYCGATSLGISSWWWRYIYFQESLPNVDWGPFVATTMVSSMILLFVTGIHIEKGWMKFK